MSRDEELEVQFSPSRWSRRYRAEEIILKHVEFITKASNAAKKTIPCQLNVPYGLSEREKLDIFGTNLSDDAPIFIYIHGGYWQELSRELSSYVVKPLHKFEFKVVILGYALCPNVTLTEIIEQIQRGVQKCIDYAKSNNSRGIYIAGHSAGAHLASMLFQSYFNSLQIEEQDLIKGIILISGVYDLVPLTKTYINDALKLDSKIARKLSPLFQNHKSNNTIQFFIIVGEYESPIFKQQSEQYYRKLKNLGKNVELVIINEVDHFDIAENLNEENYEIVKLIINLEDY